MIVELLLGVITYLLRRVDYKGILNRERLSNEKYVKNLFYRHYKTIHYSLFTLKIALRFSAGVADCEMSSCKDSRTVLGKQVREGENPVGEIGAWAAGSRVERDTRNPA